MCGVSVSKGLRVTRAADAAARWEAARIWAAATAHRDARPEPAPTSSALPIIEEGLAHGGASLHLATLREHAVGFALTVPREHNLEILYLGVDPDSWGAGVARGLLEDVTGFANDIGRPAVELWVYDDNTRAVDVYRRAGWSGTDDVRIHPRSGRRERLHIRSSSSPASR